MADETAATLVARFLRQNHYDETLNAFTREAGLPADIGGDVTNAQALTIEKIMQEKKTFDLSLSFEKTTLDDVQKGWSPIVEPTPHVVDTLASSSNVLHVSSSDLTSDDGSQQRSLVVTGADRTNHTISTKEPHETAPLILSVNDAPTLSTVTIFKRYVLMTTMSGKLVLWDTRESKIVDERRDHLKYVVKVAAVEDESGAWIATAAWDKNVLLYRVKTDSDRTLQQSDSKNSSVLGKPVAEVSLQSNPECIQFIQHPEIALPVLLLSRRDSTFLYYYVVGVSPSSNTDPTSPEEYTLSLLGRQNLAPHSNAWIAYTPSCFAIHPNDPSIVAVATSSTPHMKLIVVRLLLPPPATETQETQVQPQTQAAQARASLAQQDRESAAIITQCNTFAPQSPYSTPDVAWRPDGTGVWVNGDDGAVRGIDVYSGKVRVILKNGHDAGTKVRCVWAGMADVAESNDLGEELVVSGGFDKKLVVWRIEPVVS